MTHQSRTDSIMEVACNIAVGLIVSTAANWVVIPAILGHPLSLHDNVLISVIFTVISIVRSYALRRLFNGRSVWMGLKVSFSHLRGPMGPMGLPGPDGLSYPCACPERP